MSNIKIELFTTKNNKSPFKEWINKLSSDTANRIMRRIWRIEDGNFGDYKQISQDLYELKFDFGAGYRVYYTKKNQKIVILLAGGDKSTQKRDIEKAKLYLQEIKEKINEKH